MRILLIEDDERIARFIERGLKAEGHQIHRLKDGQYGLETVKQRAGLADSRSHVAPCGWVNSMPANPCDG